MKFFAHISLALVFASCLASVGRAEITWRESYYNPAPAQDDLVLPMRCGGAMVFRPVTTPNADGAIGDVRVTLGEEGSDQPFLSGLRRAYVSGAFSLDTADQSTAKGLFWMGKYEIAQAQWEAVMSDVCPDKPPRKRDFSPAVDLSLIDFQRFAQAYTLWLMEHAADALPTAGDTTAYLRLPTEDEWEFSARGGLAVEDAGFRAPRPPVPEGQQLSEYIAHGGTDSAGGRVQVIGTLAPNPLGLHDMLGNAAELVETPFALVRHGRLHGQAGGVVKRGGDARTPLDGITSATRFEVPPYDPRKLASSADRFTGGRLVIAGLAITSPEQSRQLIEDLDRLAQIDPSLQTATSEQEIDRVFSQLEERIDSAAGRRELTVIRETVTAVRAERNAQRNRTLRVVLGSATLVCDRVVQRFMNARVVISLLEILEEDERLARDAGDSALLEEILLARAEGMEGLEQIEAQMRDELDECANMIENLGDEYSAPLLLQQIGFIEGDVAARGERRAANLDAIETHLEMRAIDGYVDLERLQATLRTIATSFQGDP